MPLVISFGPKSKRSVLSKVCALRLKIEMLKKIRSRIFFIICMCLNELKMFLLVLAYQFIGRPKVDIGKPIKKLFKNYFYKYVVKHDFGIPVWLV